MTALFHSPRTISYYFDRSFTKPPKEKGKWDAVLEKNVNKHYRNNSNNSNNSNSTKFDFSDEPAVKDDFLDEFLNEMFN
jgi:hypothetical protein